MQRACVYIKKPGEWKEPEAGLVLGCACLTRQKLTDPDMLCGVGGLASVLYLAGRTAVSAVPDACCHTYLCLSVMLGLCSELHICKCGGCMLAE